MSAAPPSTLRQRLDSKPWYRQFWPWFVIAFPAIAVVFSFATLYVAVSGADSLVRDDYYDAGLTINRDFAREREALRRGIEATLDVGAGGHAKLTLRGEGVAGLRRLVLELAHPFDADRDRRVEFGGAGNGEFVAEASLADVLGRRRAVLVPEDDSWRLDERIDLGSSPGPRRAALAAVP